MILALEEGFVVYAIFLLLIIYLSVTSYNWKKDD